MRSTPAALGVTGRFRSCHHHMADGNFHSASLLVKWEGSSTLVSTSAPPPSPAAAVLRSVTLGKTPAFTLASLLYFTLLYVRLDG